MSKIKLLFFHFDLGGGGAEKVLVNLVNNLNPEKYDITVQTIFGKGPNRKALNKNIKFKCLFNTFPFRGTRQLLKLFSPNFLHKMLIKDSYDAEIAFLELIPTRIIGGCNNSSTRKYTWIHNTTRGLDSFSNAFRDMDEFYKVYSNFDRIAFVSQGAMDTFYSTYKIQTPGQLVHNVIDTDTIKNNGKEEIDINLDQDCLNLCSVGRLCGQKRYDRLIRSLYKAEQKTSKAWHLYLIGTGSEKSSLIKLADDLGISEKISFLGFQSNPHKYVSKMDLFVCSSESEGYSTVVTESLILGIPVLTTNCSGMDELIGETRAGMIVDNDEDALSDGLIDIFDNPRLLDAMKNEALIRSRFFSIEKNLHEFENFITEIL